jgi:hypothetical protein
MVRIHKFEYFPPSGFFLRDDGIVDYQSRLDFAERGIVATEIGPINELSKYLLIRPHDSDVTESDSWQLDRYPKEPSQYHLDMHRWVGRIVATCERVKFPGYEFKVLVGIGSEKVDFQEVVKKFSENYGDFFSNDVHGSGYVERSLLDWYNEWENIGHVAIQPEISDQKASLLELIDRKVLEHSGDGRKSDRKYAKRVGKKRIDPAINLRNWIGWCWALIARDVYDGISYSLCVNHRSEENSNGCDHEVPSITPAGKKGIKYCSNHCKMAVGRRVAGHFYK